MASGNSRKIGRNKDTCAAYKASATRDKNKRVKVKRHIKKYPADIQAKNDLKRLGGT